MIVVAVLVGLGILFAVAAVVAGRGRVMSDPVPDEIDTRVPPGDTRMAPEDIDGLRFRLAFRGYRMDQVDDVLDRVRDEIAVRDARIAALQAAPLPIAPAARTAPTAPTALAAPTEAPAAGSPPAFAPLEPVVEEADDEVDAIDADEVDAIDADEVDAIDADEVDAIDAIDADDVDDEPADEPAVEDDEEPAAVSAGPATTAYEPPSRPLPDPSQAPEPVPAEESALNRLRRRTP